jgi:hypothetical protein
LKAYLQRYGYMSAYGFTRGQAGEADTTNSLR